MGLCAVKEQGAARKSVYPSGNRHGDAKKSRCSQQPNRSLRCLTNRACAQSVAAQSHNTPEEITSCSRRKWIAAIASTHDLSDGNPETVALHRPHRGSVAAGASQSRRMQSSGLTSRNSRHDNSFRIAAIDLDQGLVGLPGEVGGQPPIYSLHFISSQLLPRIKRQDSAAFTSPNRDARQKCARLL